jgi:adenylate cyclase
MRLGSTALATERVERRLAAILAADVAGYSRLMSADEEGTHARLRAHLRQLVDPKIKEYGGRIVKNTGDGLLAEFPSVVDAVRCAVEIQHEMIDRNVDVPEDKRIGFRIGVNLGDVIVEPEDIFGDGVNIAARLEALAEPGGICISGMVHNQVRDKLPYPFEDMGAQNLKNIDRPVRAYRVRIAAAAPALPAKAPTAVPELLLPLPDKPSLAMLPFQNMSGDPDQEYFADGMVEEIITALSRIRWLFVIARNSSFTYKGQTVDVKQVGRELGVRYVLEGSVRKAGGRVRITTQDRRGHRRASLGRPLRRLTRGRVRLAGQGSLQRRRGRRTGVAGCRDRPFGPPPDQRSDRLRPLFAGLCDIRVAGKADPRGAPTA